MRPYHRVRNVLIASSLLLGSGLMSANETPTVALPEYQPGGGITEESVDRIMEWTLKTYKSPGAAVVIVKDGEIFMTGGYGIRNVDTGEPVTAETLFQLASVSKTFTAAAFADAVDNGALEWEKPASEVLPNFEMFLPYATEWVDGTDFLVHRAGFPGFFGDLFDHLGYTRNDIRHRIRFVQPGYSFRDHPEYSNIGFFLAGEMVAEAGQGTYEEVLRTSLLDPLGMNQTGTVETLLNGDTGNNFAAPHISKGDGFAVVPHNLSGVFVAAGGLASNAQDLGAYLQMLVNEGKFEGQQIIGEDALNQNFTSVITSEVGFAEFPPIDENSGFDYAPGWGVYHYNGLKVLEKGGALDGVRTLAVLIPQENFGITVLSNMNLTSLPEAVRAGVLQQMFGHPGEEDLQPIIRAKADDIDGMLLGSGDTQQALKDLSEEQIQAFVGRYTNDLYGEWAIVRDNEAASTLSMLCGPAEYKLKVTLIDDKTLGITPPIVISAMEEVEFEFETGESATSFKYDGYSFRRLGSAKTSLPVQLEDIVDQQMSEKGMTGVVVGVWKSGKEVAMIEAGVSHIAEDTPLTREDHFRIGSVTKSFTVTRILQLVDEGVLNLDDPISDHVDGLQNGSATLGELANMSSGIFNYTEDGDFVGLLFEDISAPWTPQQLVDVGNRNPPYFAPGKGWHYSNTATVLLGMAIEKATGNSLNQELQENLFSPLDLSETSYPMTPAMPEPYASGYARFEEDGDLEDLTPANPTSAAGSGAIVSTLDDLQKWGKALGEGTLISPKMREAQIQLLPNKDCPSCPEYDGYGLGIGSLEGWLGHTGDYLGYQSLVMHDAKTDQTVVILTNFRNFTNHDHLPTKLFREMAPLFAPQP